MSTDWIHIAANEILRQSTQHGGAPLLQDGIYAIIQKHAAAPSELERNAVEALEQLTDGLDANSDPERGGLSQEAWDGRVKNARAVLARHDKK